MLFHRDGTTWQTGRTEQDQSDRQALPIFPLPDGPAHSSSIE